MIKYEKIFQIGFNKCGTFSIYNLFKNHCQTQLIATHWDRGYLAYKIYNNISEGNSLPLDGYSNYTVFTDMECFLEKEDGQIQYIPIYKDFFDLLDINYQSSIFIFNTRNIDNWITSRLKHKVFYSCIKNGITNKLHNNIMYSDLFKRIYNTKNIMDITDIWKEQWIEHHNNVQQYFQYRTQNLLIYDIEQDNFSKIIDFFNLYGISFSTNKMPHDNRTK